MAVPFLEPRGIPTIFGEVLETNVTFCIDTSGSMYKGMEVVKEHLIETLLKLSKKSKPTMFNIIEFNSEVTQWADKMVTCTPQTVAVAKDWVNRLSARTGTNTKDALITALNDPLCEAVYLVTDGLPDQHPVEILDCVGHIGKLRPIHCIYLSTEDSTESAALEFLEDLAVESYGSFHVVSLTTHGCVDRITPIYRADHAHEKIIRTINGTIRPHSKLCSVSTTLQVDPDESMLLTPRVSGAYPYGYCPPLGPYWHNMLLYPYRYYYPYAWSRYRPARGWIKAQEQMLESVETAQVSPAAGALLIDKRVLARRIDDGYFYLGSVKSQILSDKFLVAFGPCKHGKYKDTTYQDTYVYDIIDYQDAKRHTILKGDRVLAPWEPEGERYGPGVVIEGHEKRQADGPDDRQITVSFTNGKTEKVPAETAVWLPSPVFERLSLELKMPKEAREALLANEDYPKESLPGYPVSGIEADPEEYEIAEPVCVEGEPMTVEGMPWRYPFILPHNPYVYKGEKLKSTTKTKSEVTSEEMNKLIPGTDMTQQELGDKVMTQLMEHKLLLDEKQREKGTTKERDEAVLAEEKKQRELQHRLEEVRRKWEQEQAEKEQAALREAREQELEFERSKDIEMERLLIKREKQQENTLKKSVSFKEDGAVINRSREEKGLCEGDSGNETMETSGSFVPYFRDTTQRDMAVNTDSSLLFHQYRRPTGRPVWKKYWKVDQAPHPTMGSAGGAFRETALQAPFEARTQRKDDPYIVEWTSPMYKYVDPYAKGDYSDTVEMLMKMPQRRPVSASTNTSVTTTIERDRPWSAEAKEIARRDFKRKKVIERQQAWDRRLQDEDHMKLLMQDQHREQVQAQIDREKERQFKEQKMVEQAREAKKRISKELRVKIEKNQEKEKKREDTRIEALRRRRERREAVEAERTREADELALRRQEIKNQRSQQRWDEVQTRLDVEEADNKARDRQHQQAKINRIRHFRDLEEDGQRKKDIRIQVTDQHYNLYRSQVLP